MILLTAVSPAMTFYSRYYIQEMLLVFFSLGLIVAGYRLLRTGRISWAITAGAFAGLMVATKETWVISVGSMVVSGAVVWTFHRNRQSASPPIRLRHGVAVAISALIVVVSFFSSFFTHWQGVSDALSRTGRVWTVLLQADPAFPWYYYLEMLTFWRAGNGPVWSRAAILVLGIAGVLSLRFKIQSETRRACLQGFIASVLFVCWPSTP
jgi:predicted membrane-bound mannosyltransferase